MYSKKYIFFSLILNVVFLFCLLSCQDDEINRSPTPSSFKVSIIEVGFDYAVISWEPVTDLDGDPLYRSINLEGETVFVNLTDDEPVRLDNLTTSKTYNGTVSITDRKSDPIIMPFEFTTETFINFKVIIQEVSQNFAVISWNAVADYEGDTLYRSVSLEGEPVISDMMEDKSVRIDNLMPSKTYTGFVTITDKKSNPVVEPFTFTTKKQGLFNKLYTEYNDQLIHGFTLCKTRDGGYAIAANVSFNQNGYGLFVMKVDSLGNEEWHTLVEAHHAISIDGNIIQTNDNGFVIVDQEAITKLNSTGDLQWQYICPIWNQQYNSVIETDDFGYLVVGMMGGSSRGSMTKFDINGNQEWEKLFDGEVMSSCGQIIKASGNDYIIAGTHQKPTVDYELAVAKIDALGNIYWNKIYEHTWQTFYIGVEIKSASQGFIIGSTSLESGGSAHARMVKIDDNGSLIWDQTYQWGGYETYCKAISSLDDGNFLFVGGYTNASHYQTAIIVKINSNGEFIWKKDYKPTNYEDFVWQFRGIEQVEEDFTLMGNKSWIWSGEGKDRGLWLLKTDENGDY